MGCCGKAAGLFARMRMDGPAGSLLGRDRLNAGGGRDRLGTPGGRDRLSPFLPGGRDRLLPFPGALTGQVLRAAPRGTLGAPMFQPTPPPFVAASVDPPPGTPATVRAAGAQGLHLRPAANRNAFSIIAVPNLTRVTVLRTGFAEDYAAPGALARWWEVEVLGRRGFIQAVGDDGRWNVTWPGGPYQGTPFVPPRITPGQPW